jgi:outer membrane protein OmpA-like peptidoglycan-associated protein
MAKPTVKTSCTFHDMIEGKYTNTTITPEFKLEPIDVLMLEMEDVLFHLDSAVMMPERPKGKSSSDGTEDDASDPDDAKLQEDQDKVSGLKALALALKQFEFDPDKHLLIAGHADTSGGTKMNFELSALRAQNVLHLLEGDRDKWSEVSKKRHRIEDYQQILTYIKDHRSWTDCDPLKIDDKWSNDVYKAIKAFIKRYNVLVYDKKVPEGSKLIPTDTADKIKNDGQHKWPIEMWRAVYDLFNDDIAEALGVSRTLLTNEYRSRLQYCDDKKKFISCGESYPIDDAEKDNYRSQVNRRVELFFFDEDNVPTIDCPPRVDSVHKAPECPMWHKYHFKRTYVDGADLTAQAYHLKFLYFDRLLKKQTEVPAGLKFKAFSDPSQSDASDLKARTQWAKGIYTVKVKKDAGRNHIHFTFERADNTKNMWVYTENKDATPQFAELTDAEYKKKIDDAAIISAAAAANERAKYYDLPTSWNSRNWRCAVKNAIKDYSDYMLNKTSPSEPIVFNLDDIVLVDETGKQAISDRSMEAGGDGKGKPKPLSVTNTPTANPPEYPSRVRILYVEPEKSQLKLYSTNSGGTSQEQYVGSEIPFQKDSAGKAKNFIKDPPGQTRALIFCHELYDVTSKRTDSGSGLTLDTGQVIGARAAKLLDSDVHSKKRILPTENTAILHSPKIGDFEIHYLHGGGCDDDKAYSYFVVYWSTGVTGDTKPTPAGTGNKRAATAAEVKKIGTAGMLNSMNHWNKKEYEFEDSAATSKHVIRPFYMFDTNETFFLTPPSPAVDFYTEAVTLFGKNEFATALRNARGGIPHSIAYVTEEDKGSWMLSFRGNNRPFSIMSLRIKTGEDDSTRFAAGSMGSGVIFPYSEFSDPTTYGCLAMAHEIGHATGQVDDYMETAKYNDNSMGVPTYGQWGVKPDGKDVKADNSDFQNRSLSSEAWALKIHPHDKTMMEKNGAIRVRHVWRFAHWLNEEGKTGKSLNKFLSGLQMRVRVPHPATQIEYFRNTAVQNNPWAFSHSATLDVKTASGTDIRKMNAYLYRHLDESGRVTRTKGANVGKEVDFKAILVVRPMLSISFLSNNGHDWTNGEMTDWLALFHNYFSRGKGLLGNKWLLAGGGGDYDPTLIHFLPGYDFYNEGSSPNHTSFNFRVEIKWDDNTFSAADQLISMGNHQSRIKELFYHLFNKPSNATAFAVADFNYLKTWFSGPSVANAAFSIEEV